MVTILQRDHIVVPGKGTRHKYGEVICLGAGVYEVANFEIARQLRREIACIGSYVRMQINRGGMLERLVLQICRSDNIGMTVADANSRYTSEPVEISPALFIEKILTFALNYHHRFPVKEKESRIQEFLSQRRHFLCGRTCVGPRRVAVRRKVRCFHSLSFLAMKCIAFSASLSNAITESSICSSLVSSILLWLIPSKLWTNIITVGMPARATSAASWRGPEGSRCTLPVVSLIASAQSSINSRSNKIGSI